MKLYTSIQEKYVPLEERLLQESFITLYHGTTNENASKILKSKYIKEPAYFTPKLKDAEEYALNNDADGVVIKTQVDSRYLEPDNESKQWRDAEEALGNDAAVYSTKRVPLKNFKFIYYIDYEKQD